VRIALYPNLSRDPGFVVTRRLISCIAEGGAEAVIEEDIAPQLSAECLIRDSYETCDLLICLGGDGTFLSAAHHESAKNLPITGVNLGSVGFLHEIDVDRMERAVKLLIDGNYSIEQRALLASSCYDTGGHRIVFEEALNDVVLARGNVVKSIDVGLEIDGERVENLPGDGVIIATPTGSTAYSLSAGGPIIHPTAEVMLITPICPHTLQNRSYVIGLKSEITLRLISNQGGAILSVDGRVGYEMTIGSRVTVGVSDRKVQYIRLWDEDFFKTLPTKIHKRGLSR
jgi:NAD+ kinase